MPLRHHHMTRSSRRAFTLLELIVVLSVLGLLAAVAIPTYQRVTDSAEAVAQTTRDKAIARRITASAVLESSTPPVQLVTAAISETSAGDETPVAGNQVNGWTVEEDTTAPANPNAVLEVDDPSNKYVWKHESAMVYSATRVNPDTVVYCHASLIGGWANCGDFTVAGPVDADDAADADLGGGAPSGGGGGPVTPVDPVPVDVEAGVGHTCAIDSAGALYCWGWNSAGQLGDGTTTDSAVPVPVPGFDAGVTAVSTGFNHTCAIRAGAAWCWGDNLAGQLGDGTTDNSASPVPVTGLSSGVTAITAGAGHSCAVRSGGAYCWGNGDNFLLGFWTILDYPTATAVPGLASGVTAIDAGFSHTCAIRSGAAWCWGNNPEGQLGHGVTSSYEPPAQVVGLGSGVTAIVAGSNSHSCAVVGGAVSCWGSNYNGELGDGGAANVDTPVAVIGGTGAGTLGASGSHTCALLSGAVSCWGSNSAGQFGNGTADPSPTPTPALGLTGVIDDFSAGEGHTCALHTDSIWCWGWNDFGQVGNGVVGGVELAPVEIALP